MVLLEVDINNSKAMEEPTAPAVKDGEANKATGAASHSKAEDGEVKAAEVTAKDGDSNKAAAGEVSPVLSNGPMLSQVSAIDPHLLFLFVLSISERSSFCYLFIKKYLTTCFVCTLYISAVL